MEEDVKCSTPACGQKVVGGFRSIVPANTFHYPPIINGQRKLWCKDHELALNRHLGQGRYIFPKRFSPDQR